MEKITNLILCIITTLCIYIILNIGLGWFWTIGMSENHNRINQVLLNLSYSYIAGVIFYLLVSYFPNKFKKWKFNPIIKSKTKDLYNQINACVQTFELKENPDIIRSITEGNLKVILSKKGMYDNSFYADMVGYQMNNLKFLHSTRINVFEIIESLLIYKSYLSGTEISDIEQIKDSKFFHLIKIYEETPTAKLFYNSPQFKDELSNELYNIIKHVRRLRK